MLEVKQELLHANFSGLTMGEFILVIKSIADCIEDHPSFTGILSGYVSASGTLREFAGRLEALERTSAGGDRDQVAEKKRVREEAERCLVFNAAHLVMDALHKRDESLLHGAGYELKDRSSTKSSGASHLPEIPANLRVKNGPVPGTLSVTVKRPQVFGSVDVQICDGNPMTESDWRDAGKFYQCRFELKGLESVKKYYLKVRFENAAGTGPWSQVASVVVL